MLTQFGRMLQRVGSRLAPPIKNTALAYEAAGMGRRARGWIAPAIGANDALLGSLDTLRARSRAGVRQDGFARAAVDRIVSNCVGTGITPESKAPDPVFRKQLHAKFLAWTDEADSAGIGDFYSLEAQICRAWLEGGEVFVRLRNRLPVDGLTVPFQLQVIEPEHCPTSLTFRQGDRSVRAGIEMDGIGRKTFYHLYRSRPAEGSDLDTTQLSRVPADSVIHVYDQLRPGQLRGAPLLTQALITLHELDAYTDATVVRQKVAALYAAFLERPLQPGDADVDPITGKAVERDENDNAMVGLEPGLVQELNPGEKMTFSDPPDTTGLADFMRAILMQASVAADLPYEVLTGDMRAVNDRTVRVILNEFRRRIEQRQHFVLVYQLCRPVWNRWFERGVLSGSLVPPPGVSIATLLEDPQWRAAEWIPAAWPYLHPVQDVEAYNKAIRNGIMTRAEAIKEIRGRSFEEVMEEYAAEQELLDRLGIILDSDPRKTAGSGQPTIEREPEPATP